jgi:hypothetical protein
MKYFLSLHITVVTHLIIIAIQEQLNFYYETIRKIIFFI